MIINLLTSRWLKECVQLSIVDDNGNEDLSSFVIDDCLVIFPLNLFNYNLENSHFFLIQGIGLEFG
jgi:hypothetical protein